MVTVTFQGGKVSVPLNIGDIEAFRRWYHSDDFPEDGNIWWLDGEVWADMSGEQIFSHVLVKTEMAGVLRPLTKAERLGLYLTDGVLLSNFEGDLSGKPDGTFLTTDTLGSDRVRLIEGKDAGYVEIQGTPDMVLEVLSDSSVHKDKVLLREGYSKAGIPEYWLVDARTDPPRFDILRRGPRGYSATRRQGEGWLRSRVFGRSFRLVRGADALGHPEFSLEVRP